MTFVHEFAILENGQVVRVEDYKAYVDWWLSNDSWRISCTQIGHAKVVTHFLGINHGSAEEPLWFETNIFGGSKNGYTERFKTLEEAKEGHRKALKLIGGLH